MNPAAPVHGLWCATLTPLDASGGVDHAMLAAHAQVAARARRRRRRAVRNHRRGPVVFARRTPRRRGCAAGGRHPAAASRRGDRLRRAAGNHRAHPARRARPDAPRASCCRRSSGRTRRDDGLFAWYAQVIEAVADARLRIYLYHIPQVSGTPLSVDLVARLAAAFPGIVAGVKDSAGDWANTQALLARGAATRRSWSATNRICRGCCAPAAPAPSAASPICSRSWCARCCCPTVTPADETARRRRSSKLRFGSRSSPASRRSSPSRRATRHGGPCARRWCRLPWTPRQGAAAALCVDAGSLRGGQDQ